MKNDYSGPLEVRGQTTTGTWVEGYAYLDATGTYIKTFDGGRFPSGHKVFPETICQYTGIWYFNRKKSEQSIKIFGGDVFNTGAIVVWSDNGWQVKCKGSDKYEYFIPLPEYLKNDPTRFIAKRHAGIPPDQRTKPRKISQ